jgi:hypothetical protein
MQQVVTAGWKSRTTVGKTIAAPAGGPAHGYPALAQQTPSSTSPRSRAITRGGIIFTRESSNP